MTAIMQAQQLSEEYLDWHEEGGKVRVSVRFKTDDQFIKPIFISEARANYLRSLGSTLIKTCFDDVSLLVQIKDISNSKIVLAALDLKEEFLLSQLFGLSFQGAAQRGNLYKKDLQPSAKEDWRKKLAVAVMKLPFGHVPFMDDKAYLNLLVELQSEVNNWSESKGILVGGVWRVGSVQKLVNLWLKYLWCAGFLKFPPPHFPVDRVILQHIPGMQDVSWTKMDSWENSGQAGGVGSYMTVINGARAVSAGEPLAVWELREWRSPSRLQ